MISKRPQIVDAKNVIGVGVGVEDGVELRDVFAQCLLAEVGRGVDNNVAAVVCEHDRRTGAAVVGIGGMANRAIAPDGGNAHRGATAQNRQLRMHQPLVPVLGPGACGARASALVTSTYAMRSS